MLEKQIEAKVCAYAKERGLLVYKFTSPARAAVPDRMFVLPSGKIFFCEFKRSGEKPTQAQEREHHRLRQHKVVVYVIDDVFSGLRMVDDMIAYATP
jgi:hypothetical protein